MSWNLDAVGQEAAPTEEAWTSNDALLYALGVGAGVTDPVGSELEFTTDNSIGVEQKVLPTFGVVLATGGAAFGLAGSFDATMAVHGEQGIELAGPLPPEGRVTTTSRLAGIYDKGAGAVVAVESRSVDAATGEWRFTTTSSLFLRGGGGFGGDRGPPAARTPLQSASQTMSCRWRPDAIRRCSTACRATTILCIRTRNSPNVPALTCRSFTACARTGLQGDSFSMRSVGPTRPVSCRCTGAFRNRSGPGTP